MSALAVWLYYVRVGRENRNVICICNTFILFFGCVGKSDVHILNNVGESTSPFGTPVFLSLLALILCCCIV